MGTNYYWRQQTHPGCEACGRKPEYDDLHIGKSSAGWTFSFHADEGRGLTSWRAWKEFLIQGEAEKRGEIVDEYDVRLTFEEFRSVVEERSHPRGLRNHAELHGHVDRSFLDPEGHSMSPGEFS